ncbi:MAG: MFS transporter [Halanaerobiales bacterium]
MYNIVLRKFVPFVQELDKSTRYNFKIDALSAVTFGVFAGAFFPFFAVTGVRLGANGLLLALITAAPFMGQLFAVYWGHKSEQGQKLPFIVTSGLISRGILILLALTRRVEIFALLVVLHFLLASAGTPAYTALMKKIYPIQYRGKLMGKVQFLIGLMRVVITYYGGIWLDLHGYRTLFIIAGTAGIISSIIYGRINEPEEEFEIIKNKFSLKEFLQIFKSDKLLRLALLGFFIFDLGNLMLAPIYPVIQVRYLGLNNLQIGQLSIFWIMGWFIFAPYWGRMVDEHSPVKAVKFAVIIFMLQPLIYFFRLPYLLLITASFTGGVAASSLEVGWLNMMINLGGNKSSRYSGLYLTILGIRGILGPVMGNILLSYIEPFNVFIVSLGLLSAGYIPFIFYERLKSKKEERVKYSAELKPIYK